MVASQRTDVSKNVLITPKREIMDLNHIYSDLIIIGSKKFVRRCNKRYQNVSVMKRPTYLKTLRKRVMSIKVVYAILEGSLACFNMSDVFFISSFN